MLIRVMNQQLDTAVTLLFYMAAAVVVAIHLVWMLYVLYIDRKWKYARGMQRECGDQALEMDTVRWIMKNEFDSAKKEKLMNATIISGVITFGIFIAYIYLKIVFPAQPFTAVTENEFLELLQSIPRSVYIAFLLCAIMISTLVFTILTIGKFTNKLKSLTSSYAGTLEDVKANVIDQLRTVSETTPLDLKLLRSKIVERVGNVNNAESTEMSDAIFDSLSSKDLLGYLNFATDSQTNICTHISREIANFNTAEMTAFRNVMAGTNATDTKHFLVNDTTQQKFEQWKKYANQSLPKHAVYLKGYISSLNFRRDAYSFRRTWFTQNRQTNEWSFKLGAANYNGQRDNVKAVVMPVCNDMNRDDRRMSDIRYGDPSPGLQRILRSLKIYFAFVFIIFVFIVYQSVEEPLYAMYVCVLVIISVVLYAYLGQMSR